MRTTTLRQLIYKALQEIFKKEDPLLRSELHTLTDFILNNSSLEITTSSISLRNGSFLGIGNENKDKTLTLPRFLLFALKDRNAYDFEKGKKREWTLKSFLSLEDLENALGHYSHYKLKPVAFIDGEIIDYEYDNTTPQGGFGGTWGTGIRWSKDMYEVSYFLDDMVIAERYKSKKSLENWLLVLVDRGAEDIEVSNLVEHLGLGFHVTGTLYDSNKSEEMTRTWLMWQEYKSDDENERDVWGSLDDLDD